MIVHSTDHKNQTLGNSTRGHSTTIHPLGIIQEELYTWVNCLRGLKKIKLKE